MIINPIPSVQNPAWIRDRPSWSHTIGDRLGIGEWLDPALATIIAKKSRHITLHLNVEHHEVNVYCNWCRKNLIPATSPGSSNRVSSFEAIDAVTQRNVERTQFICVFQQRQLVVVFIHFNDNLPDSQVMVPMLKCQTLPLETKTRYCPV